MGKLIRYTDKEDGRIVYIYTLDGYDAEMPVYQSDIQSGIVTEGEVYMRLVEMRDTEWKLR